MTVEKFRPKGAKKKAAPGKKGLKGKPKLAPKPRGKTWTTVLDKKALLEIGRCVRQARIRYNFKQDMLGEALGYGHSMVSHIEKGTRGDRTVDLPLLFAIAEILGCGVNELVPGRPLKAGPWQARVVEALERLEPSVRRGYIKVISDAAEKTREVEARRQVGRPTGRVDTKPRKPKGGVQGED